MADDVRVRAELLDETRWANEFTWPEIQNLAAHLKLIRIPRGGVVCREGETDPSLFIIASGTVEVLKQDTGERSKLIARLGKGQTIGEMALVEGQARSATVMASDELVLLTLHRAELERLIEQTPRLAVKLVWKLARLLSQRLRQTSGALADHLEVK